MLGRILRSADFVRVLGVPACARSPHFAIHFLDGRPSRPVGRRAAVKAEVGPLARELSTGAEQYSAQAVDDSVPATALATVAQAWLGTVVPKRHAKRAVTRTLIKRQIRAALLRRDVPGQPPLRAGLWVVRLRSPFDRALFPSAASGALRDTAGSELDAVLGQAVRKLAATPASTAAAVMLSPAPLGASGAA